VRVCVASRAVVAIVDVDVSYGDALAASNLLRRLTTSEGVGVNVNERNAVSTFLWYRPVQGKLTAGCTSGCRACGR
jgi:hypothetical protein